MTTHSMQDIIQVENQLHASEQAEREKAAAWLKNEKATIQAEHQRQLSILEKETNNIREEARKEAEKKASEIISRASEKAEGLKELQDEYLRRSLTKHIFAIITGNYT